MTTAPHSEFHFANRMSPAQLEIGDLIDALAYELHSISSWAPDAELQVWHSLVSFAEGAYDEDELRDMSAEGPGEAERKLTRLLELVRAEGGFCRGRAHLLRQHQTDVQRPDTDPGDAVTAEIEVGGYDHMPRWERLHEMELLTGRGLPR